MGQEPRFIVASGYALDPSNLATLLWQLGPTSGGWTVKKLTKRERFVPDLRRIYVDSVLRGLLSIKGYNFKWVAEAPLASRRSALP